MNKQEFLFALNKALKSTGVNDISDILAEYEQHFAFKLGDGYSEEEIVARLGNPKDIATQYDPINTTDSTGRKVLTAIGLFFADFALVCIAVCLFAFNVVLGAASLACAALGISLIGSFDLTGIIPPIPNYLGSLIAGLATLALGVLFFMACVYFFLYLRQLIRAYRRWHKGTLSVGSPHLPPLPLTPQLNPRLRRRLRALTLWSTIICAAGFIMGAFILSAAANFTEFWHTWGWFQ